MPAHARIVLRGQGGGAVSWLYAVDSLDSPPVSGRLRSGFTRLENVENSKPAISRRLRGSARTSTDKQIQASKYRRAKVPSRGAQLTREYAQNRLRQLAKWIA